MSSDHAQSSKPPLDLDWLKALDLNFPADATELAIPGVEEATVLMRERRFDLYGQMAEVSDSFLRHFGDGEQARLKRVQDALALSFARMASRHGSWGHDLHHYHNEGHALELLNGRLVRIRQQFGWEALSAERWILMALFATCHDLRQRETVDYLRGVGANERASIAEAFRILDVCGFDRVSESNLYETLGWMIAGSTFDARPVTSGPFNTAEDAASGGCLAPKLVIKIRNEIGPLAEQPKYAERFELMLLSADLDTANVGEPFLSLVGSAVRLALEREMRSGRDVASVESAEPVFDFLTNGQEHYFNNLHRFVSEMGDKVFGPGKEANRDKVKAQGVRMRERYADRLGELSGQNLIDAYVESAAELA